MSQDMETHHAQPAGRRRGDDPQAHADRVAFAFLGIVALVAFTWVVIFLLQHPPYSTVLVIIFTAVAVLGLVMIALAIDSTLLTSGVGRFVQAIAPIIPGAKVVGTMATRVTRTLVPGRPLPTDDQEPRP